MLEKVRVEWFECGGSDNSFVTSVTKTADGIRFDEGKLTWEGKSLHGGFIELSRSDGGSGFLQERGEGTYFGWYWHERVEGAWKLTYLS